MKQADLIFNIIQHKSTIQKPPEKKNKKVRHIQFISRLTWATKG